MHCRPQMKVGRMGFTLMELLVVMGIMVLLMGIGLTGWFGIRRGVEMRGAVSSVRTTMLLARQQAVTKRAKVTVSINSDATGNYLSTTATTDNGVINVHAAVYLPKGVAFTNSVSTVTFNPVGNVSASGPQEINLVETVAQSGGHVDMWKVTVWPLTGVTKVAETIQ